MQAMILAAGRGQRMRPLTDTCPKPLLQVGGRTLLDWHLQRLATAGFARVVINIAWLGESIRAHCAAYAPAGLEVVISDEGEHSLETAGGIINALPLLGKAPFALINADVWCDFDWADLPSQPEGLGHLVLVDNPAHHQQGDFYWADPLVRCHPPGERLTYAGIACLRPELFAGQSKGVAPLAPLLQQAINQEQITAQHHRGAWSDVGTPERLAALRLELGD